MIQRIQTLYLLIALILNLLTYFYHWVIYKADNAEITYGIAGLSTQETSISLLVVFISMNVSIILLSILQFKNRKRQMNSVRASMMLAILLCALFGIRHYQNIQLFQMEESLEISYQFPVFVPIISLVFLWLALNGIKKDEDLVRSIDRLR
ncbi:MAG: DUF4293 family protein [Salibacteraceae bacterium]